MGKCTCAQAESTEFSLVIWVRLIEIRWAFLLRDLSAGFLPRGSSDAGPREGLYVDGASLGPLSFALATEGWQLANF